MKNIFFFIQFTCNIVLSLAIGQLEEDNNRNTGLLLNTTLSTFQRSINSNLLNSFALLFPPSECT